MKSLGLLNFLVALNLVNLTSNIQCLDLEKRAFDDLGIPDDARVGSPTIAGAATGANSSPNTYVVNFGTDNSASSGSAADDVSPRRTPSPLASRDFVDATGAIRGLSGEIATLFSGDLDRERKPVLPVAEAIGMHRAGGSVWPRVTKDGKVRPGAARRTRTTPSSTTDDVGSMLACGPLTRLETIPEISPVLPEPVHTVRVRSRSDSSPRVSSDRLISALMSVAGAAEQSSAHLAEQVQAAHESNRLLEQKLALQVREFAEHQIQQAAELAEKAAYARRPWYKRAEARAEFLNCTAVLCSMAAGATAITALYYQNNPQ